MSLLNILFISIGASTGALLRWWFGLLFNNILPSFPLGTLASNLIGGFLMGLFLGLSKIDGLLSETTRLFIATGFLGGLTTFSSFSAEVLTLFTQQEYGWTALLVVGHVAGTLLATFFGLLLIKQIFPALEQLVK